jgi:hypothetical protein
LRRRSRATPQRTYPNNENQEEVVHGLTAAVKML